jgi:cation diffusion facilitator CzcD-associated flavoprotein CzcO
MATRRANTCEVAVIGAGPYGLSVAAHLNSAGFSTRVFGEPMSFWRRHMPAGMMLRSPWRASHISDVDGALSLQVFASRQGIDLNRLIPRDDFVAYGEWFQARAVPDIDLRAVRRIDGSSDGFELELGDGDTFAADRVVIATGLANQEYRPTAFRDLPAACVTHTCEHADFAAFRGKRVAVVGRGQSACESSALLAEAGAEVELVSRGAVRWLGAAAGKSAARQWPIRQVPDILHSPSAVGPFPLSWLAEWPAAAGYMPPALRDAFSRRCLKAGASGWLKPRFANVKCNSSGTIGNVRVLSGRVEMDLDRGASTFDHVLLGTGYRVDILRLGIFSPQLSSKINRVEGSPLLGAGLESSVPKLHFVGAYAVKSYGPLLRFIAGAPYAAYAVTKAALVRKTPGAVAGPTRKTGPSFGRTAPDLLPPR